MQTAIILSEYDESKIRYGYMKKQTQGNVVNVYYESSYFTLQTPLINTFGLSEYEGNWSMNLNFHESNGVDSGQLEQFKTFLTRFKEKVIDDIVSKKYYIEWLNVKDKWDKHSDAMKKELVSQKINNDFLKFSKRDTEKKYPPTMSLKVQRKKETDEFKIVIHKLNSENKYIVDDEGEPYDFVSQALSLLHSESQEVKSKPPVYCLINFNIWIINSNIYITPTCTHICMTPLKEYSKKATFNPRGFLLLDENEQSSVAQQSSGSRNGYQEKQQRLARHEDESLLSKSEQSRNKSTKTSAHSHFSSKSKEAESKEAESEKKDPFNSHNLDDYLLETELDQFDQFEQEEDDEDLPMKARA